MKKTLSDPAATTLGVATSMFVLLLPVATALLIPFWALGKAVEWIVETS